jgi:L-alanine-DL-glutamate epimerase-like enolase superfamily enzyme
MVCSGWRRWSRSAPRCRGNYIAFEYPAPQEAWWYDIVEGLPDPIVVDSYIEVWDRPGMGVEFKIPAAKAYLSDEDRDFFD